MMSVNSIMLWWMLIVCVLASMLREAQGFDWAVAQRLDEAFPVRITEGHVFASHRGPPLLGQGPSYIHLQNKVTAYTKHNVSSYIHILIYSTDEPHAAASLPGMCDHDMKQIFAAHYASNVHKIRLQTKYRRCGHVNDALLRLNGTYCSYDADVDSKYAVSVEAWYNVVYVLCDGYVPQKRQLPSVPTTSAGSSGFVFTVAKIEGSVTFRNPYGFLPGELYGLLPFEVLRTALYGVCFLVFVSYYLYFRKTSLLNLHHWLLLVLSLALVESGLWCSSFFLLNNNGTPYCCPYPSIVKASLIFQVLRQTLSRTALLLVSLGYGIVRPKLLTSEYVAVVVVSVLYLVSALVAQSFAIVLSDTAKASNLSIAELKQVNSSGMAEAVMDFLFLTYIYFAISSTMRILTMYKQRAKVELFRALIYIIVTFVLLFLGVSMLFMLDAQQVIDWPWQLQWLQQVLWETLNLVVIASMSILCRPAENSHLLAYATQLPQDDQGEHGSRSTSILDDDDDEDEEFLNDHDQKHLEMVGYNKYRSSNSSNAKVASQYDSFSHDNSNHGAHRYDSLPRAVHAVNEEDDEEFGIHDE